MNDETKSHAADEALASDIDTATAPTSELPTVPLGAVPIDVVAQLKTEANEARDRALRAQAELDNVRKRLYREMDEERKYANLPLLGDLLPVLDNIGRAIEAAQKTTDAAVLIEGFKLVQQQLETVFGRHHCQRIAALHQPFDPHRHMAIMQQPSTEYVPNTVLFVAQEGYQLHDRVIRPSQVIVAGE